MKQLHTYLPRNQTIFLNLLVVSIQTVTKFTQDTKITNKVIPWFINDVSNPLSVDIFQSLIIELGIDEIFPSRETDMLSCSQLLLDLIAIVFYFQ
jgi:hypothetical protein